LDRIVENNLNSVQIKPTLAGQLLVIGEDESENDLYISITPIALLMMQSLI
jgi:hypothetical protein